MPLAIGTVLENRYRIDALLGQSGMGARCRAWHLRLHQVTAKALPFQIPAHQCAWGDDGGVRP